MPRIRPACILLAWLSVSTVVRAQDWRDDDSIWGFGNIGGPHRAGPREPDPAPIVPGDWIAVPAASGEAALLAFPWILDPERAAPRAGEDGWTAKLGVPLAAAACAYASVHSEADEVRMARLTGARWLVVNGSVHIGDPERRGDRGVPVALKKGENRVFVVEATEGWELELWKPATRCVIGTWDVGWPNVTGNAEDVEYPVFNTSVDTARYLHVHYAYAAAPPTPVSLTDWRDGGVIAPLALLVRGHYLHEFGVTDSGKPVGARTPVCVYAGDDAEAARELLCDLDASYSRRRLEPRSRALGRDLLADRPQGRIPRERPMRSGTAKMVVLVHGTLGTPEEDAALLARARLDQQVLWYACGEAPWILSDSDFVEHGSLEGEEAKCSLIRAWIDRAEVVFYGNPQVNGGWEDLTARARAIEVAAGVTRGAQAPGDGGAWTVAWNERPEDAVARAGPKLGFGSVGLAGARLSLALGMLSAQDGIVRVDARSRTGFSPVSAPK